MRWSLLNIRRRSRRDNWKAPHPGQDVNGTYLFLLAGDVFCAVLWLYSGLRKGNQFNFIVAALWLAAGLLNLLQYRKQKKKNQREEENNG